APITIRIKPDQTQQLQVYKAGYKLHNQQIRVAPEQTKSQQVKLQPDITQVRFSITPADAELYVDGVLQGRGSRTLALNTLPHEVRVRKAGYVSYKNQIIPTKASNQVVSIRLLTKAEDFWARVPDRYTTKGGHTMKLFRSPGEVVLGSSRRETGRRSNEVEYKARLDKHFYASLHEVTNKQFRQFKANHNSGNYKRRSLDSNKHPVANVSWQQAALYCNWLSKQEGLSPFYRTKAGFVSGNIPDANGYRLLTEVEWSWLARNQDSGLLVYPWGNTPEITTREPIGNFADISAVEFIAFTLQDYNDGYKASAPVGRFPANQRGLYDLAGNVSEWVNDWYSSNSQYATGEQPLLVDPLGPDEGEFHVIRGASWARGHLPQLRLAYRDFGAKGKHDVGFRIARYVGKPQ
ncbi:MAG: SUMF1/EgtB/PvdO family nonheme iron enzyme, partial [Gammaproteobacteria bacterium]|nr:SUMF1/EgtB/PvdO family nonheme iron enzyme [Gammaproteobacteria bacterium]